jgi:hypothetical protein
MIHLFYFRNYIMAFIVKSSYHLLYLHTFAVTNRVGTVVSDLVRLRMLLLLI